MARDSLIQIRRDTAANWASVNPVLAAGEPGFETDTRKEKVGNGTTAWNSLPYLGVAPVGQRNYFSSLGTNPAVVAVAAAAGAGVLSANQANLITSDPAPFDMTITKLLWYVNTTGANYDIGIYNMANTLLWSKGSTATPAVGLVTETVSPGVTVPAGSRIKFAWASDSTTPLARGALATNGFMLSDMDGSFYQVAAGSSFPLPSTITPGGTPATRIPFIVAQS